MNKFAEAVKMAANYTTTENGHDAVSTTGSCVLDLYGQVGGLRNADKDRVYELFERAIAEDKLLAARTMFYTRDCRGGVGERELFRTLLKYAANKYPEMVKPNLEYISEFGRWDDLYALVGTPLETDMFKLIKRQIELDVLHSTINMPVSLAAKWLKSCNASSPQTRHLGRLTAKALEMSEHEYRCTLSMLRAYLAIVERNMSNNEWERINYEKLPSRANLVYREAFERHDAVRYNQFIADVRAGKKNIHAAMNTPQDIIHAYLKGTFSVSRDVDPTLEALWKNLPDFVNTDENIMCMVDVSGSMYGRPIEISTGLGIYFAEHNRGAFHNLFMTFDSNPRFFTLENFNTLQEKIHETFRAPWGGSTNLNGACQEMLRFARAHNVPDRDMPRRLIIISDMEIDEATNGWGHPKTSKPVLHSDELRKMYESAGYTMPQIIYWNADSRDNHFQTRSNTPGVMLASGSSPAVFQAVLELKDYQITPVEAMKEILNNKYSMITVE